MSQTLEQTTEQLENEQIFAQAPVEAIPDTYCIGTITKMDPAKVSKSEKYLHARFEVTPAPGTSGIEAKGGITFRPIWFYKSFDVADLERGKGTSWSGMVYDNNIVPGKKSAGQSILQGLCYNQARFFEVASAIRQLTVGLESEEQFPIDKYNELIMEAVTPGGKAATDADGDRLTVIYKLKQRTEKNEMTGEKDILPGLQFDSFMWNTEATVAYLTKRAEEKGDIRLTWLKGE